MNSLVKLLTDDDGDPVDKEDQRWHLVDPCNRGGRATLCTGEFFGLGESQCEYEEKTAERGGITCQHCVQKLKAYKAVRLAERPRADAAGR